MTYDLSVIQGPAGYYFVGTSIPVCLAYNEETDATSAIRFFNTEADAWRAHAKWTAPSR